MPFLQLKHNTALCVILRERSFGLSDFFNIYLQLYFFKYLSIFTFKHNSHYRKSNFIRTNKAYWTWLSFRSWETSWLLDFLIICSIFFSVRLLINQGSSRACSSFTIEQVERSTSGHHLVGVFSKKMKWSYLELNHFWAYTLGPQLLLSSKPKLYIQRSSHIMVELGLFW